MSQAFLQCSQAAGSEKSVVSEKSTTIVRSLVPVTQWKTKSCCMWNYGKPCESTFPTFCSKSRFHHSRILEGHQEPVLVWSWMLHFSHHSVSDHLCSWMCPPTIYIGKAQRPLRHWRHWTVPTQWYHLSSSPDPKAPRTSLWIIAYHCLQNLVEFDSLFLCATYSICSHKEIRFDLIASPLTVNI